MTLEQVNEVILEIFNSISNELEESVLDDLLQIIQDEFKNNKIEFKNTKEYVKYLENNYKKNVIDVLNKEKIFYYQDAFDYLSEIEHYEFKEDFFNGMTNIVQIANYHLEKNVIKKLDEVIQKKLKHFDCLEITK